MNANFSDHRHDEHGGEELEALLRLWHAEHAERARAQRDELMAAVRGSLAAKRAEVAAGEPFSWASFRRKLVKQYMPIAASLALIVTLAVFLVPMSAQPAYAESGVIMAPEGGRLDALDERGNLIGPCALKHTDVNVEVSGFLARVTLTQQYHNPYDQKIEAVYTFPMSHRGAVDGFKMTVGDRIIIGEVKERQAARQIYEAARESGYVASLLEQERPNIFTQSVANIEPKATVNIEISYIELIEAKDGEYEFSFPMVVGPRYIPGSPSASHVQLPAELKARRGVVLLGPARLVVTAGGDLTTLGSLQPGKLEAIIESAQAIEYPGSTWWGEGDPAVGGAPQPTLWNRFEAEYGDGSKEFGELFTDGTGWINGRWFYFDPAAIKDMGAGFEQNTNQVPDASRITPMPVKPETRAGHDISLTMTIDTGGPGITAVNSALHKITGGDIETKLGMPPRRLTIALENQEEIPNRDFVVTWKQTNDAITEAVFTHTGEYGDYTGGFFTLILQPPDRVPDWPVRPRELVFVMDTSGSMSGIPIEKSKEVIRKAIASMRPNDTFNVITFAGSTAVLWPEPRPATDANRAAAMAFVEQQQGGGGTEMMNAINAALVQQDDPEAAFAGPKPMRIVLFLTDGYVGNDAEIIQAVRDNAKTTRVFSFGIGDSINRYLLDSMAEAGRGEVEYVLLNSDGDAAAERFTKRIETPVLTDISLSFSDGLDVTDIVPNGGMLPDLFDAKPLIIQGRYQPGKENRKGTLTIRGNTGAGPYERTLDVEFPAHQPEHKATATLWARSMVDAFTKEVDHDRGATANIVKLGETFQIMTPYTSFVAVEKSRVTLDGKPVLVAIPVELPHGTKWEGFFGGEALKDADDVGRAGIALRTKLGYSGDDEQQEVMRYPLQVGQASGVGETAAVGQETLGLPVMMVRDPNANSLSSIAPNDPGQVSAGSAETFAGVPAVGAAAQREKRSGRTTPQGAGRQLAAVAAQERNMAPASAAAPSPEKAGAQFDESDRRRAMPPPMGAVAAPSRAGRVGDADAAVADGGGGGGGFGGSIFDEPAEPRGGGTIFDAPSEKTLRTLGEIYREQSKNIVMDMLYADLWDDRGGDALHFEWAGETPMVVPLKRDPSTLAAAIIAQAFVDHYLPVLRPDLELEFAGFRGRDGTDFVDSPENIALLKKLSEKRISVSMKDATLEAVLQAIATMGDVPIVVDWEALNEYGIAPSSSCSLDVADVSVERALRAALKSSSEDSLTPEATVMDGTVLVSSHERLASRAVICAYELPKRDDNKQILAVITSQIAAEDWTWNGGTDASLQAVDHVLFVRGSVDVHRQVRALLAGMRTSELNRDEAAAASDRPTSWMELAAQQLNRLARVLDPALIPVALARDAGDDAERAEAMRLTLLVSSIEAPAIRAIETLGVKVEGTSPAGPLVVATVPPRALWNLAMLDGVRRIEPLNARSEE